MATILVTVRTSDRRVDLALPGDVPVARLIPGIVSFVSDGGAGERAVWALAPVGRSPFAPDRSLAQIGIVDGAILELREVGRAAPEPIPHLPMAPENPKGDPPDSARRPLPLSTSGAWSAPPPAGSASAGTVPVTWPPELGSSRPTDVETPSPWRGSPRPGQPPPVDPRRRPIDDPMGEFDESMAAMPRATPTVRNASLSTSLAFLFLVLAGAVFVAQYAITKGKPAPTSIMVSGLGALAILYYGGLKHALLEPVLDHVPGGESVLALGGGSHGGVAAPLTDAEISERLQRLGTMVEEFIYDLALLLAGHNPPLDYVNHATVEKLRANVAPFLSSGQKLRPNFGHHGDMKVHWDPNNDVDPVSCEVLFEDMSTRETDQGERIVGKRHRIMVTLELDPTISRVLDASLQPAPAQDHSAPPPE